MVKSINSRDYNKWRAQFPQENSSIGFVPTMGALHQGHLYLVNKLSVNAVSGRNIFVNQDNSMTKRP